MMTFDLTHWIGARPADCMDTPWIYCNDCNEFDHERFIVQCKVKFKTAPKTRSLFTKWKPIYLRSAK